MLDTVPFCALVRPSLRPLTVAAPAAAPPARCTGPDPAVPAETPDHPGPAGGAGIDSRTDALPVARAAECPVRKRSIESVA